MSNTRSGVQSHSDVIDTGESGRQASCTPVPTWIMSKNRSILMVDDPTQERNIVVAQFWTRPSLEHAAIMEAAPDLLNYAIRMAAAGDQEAADLVAKSTGVLP